MKQKIPGKSLCLDEVSQECARNRDLKLFLPWAYQDKGDGDIAEDLFVYVDYDHPIMPTEEV